jgi:hypothetical protein
MVPCALAFSLGKSTAFNSHDTSFSDFSSTDCGGFTQNNPVVMNENSVIIRCVLKYVGFSAAKL